jgi:hypothetical protein
MEVKMRKVRRMTLEDFKDFLMLLESGEELFTDNPTDLLCPYIYSRKLRRQLRKVYLPRNYRRDDYTHFNPKNVQGRITELSKNELITSIFYLTRAERFCGGTIASAIKSGYLESILKQLIKMENLVQSDK